MLSWGIGTALEGGLRDLAKTVMAGDPAMHAQGDNSKERNVAFKVMSERTGIMGLVSLEA